MRGLGGDFQLALAVAAAFDMGVRDAVRLAYWLELALVGAALAAAIATLLLVARNGLAPLQAPLTFGLVFWAGFLVFYAAIALSSALGIWLLASLTRQAWLPRFSLLLATIVFLGAALGSNRATLALLLALDGPLRFRWLAPSAVLLCALALLAQGLCTWSKRVPRRLLATLGAAAGIGALLPTSICTARSDQRAPAARHSPSGERILLVGVDGADWDYIDPLIARGELPNFAALRQKGAWGKLETLNPTRSPAIWTSIVSGRTPEDHGVTDFVSSRLRGVDQALPMLQPVAMVGFGAFYAGLRKAGQVYETPTSSADRRVPAFWNIATAHASPVNLVSWWATWPAETVLGNVVSEPVHQWPPNPEGGKPGIERLTHPEGLYAEIAHHIMRPEEITLKEARTFMYVTPQDLLAIRARAGTGIDRELSYYFSYFETTRRVTLDLIERGKARYGAPPDTFVLFRIVDKMCHTSLPDSELVADRSLPSEERVRRYGRVVTAAYRAVDSALGELVSTFGEGGSVVVLSDHGFELSRHRGQPANHKFAPEGIFIAAGPPFRPGRLDGLGVYSILPLLLYLKGFPVADDFAGRLDERLIAADFLARHPVRRVASYGTRDAPGAFPSNRAADEEALEHLRTLGYLE